MLDTPLPVIVAPDRPSTLYDLDGSSLDTFPFIWLTSEPLKLSTKAKEVLSDESNEF